MEEVTTSENEIYNLEFKNICKEVTELIDANNLKQSDRLSTSNPLIIAARQSLAEKNDAYRFKGLITTGSDILNIEVSPGNVSRALCFMDFFIKVIKMRGHDIVTKPRETNIILNTNDGEKAEEIRVILREKCKRVAIKSNSWEHRELQANGILYFKSDGYHSGEWSEGRKKLEDQIPNMIAKWELSAKELHGHHKMNRLLREEEEAIERKAMELEERKEKELSDFNVLLMESARWEKVKVLRRYLQEIEQSNKQIDRNQTPFLKGYRAGN